MLGLLATVKLTAKSWRTPQGPVAGRPVASMNCLWLRFVSEVRRSEASNKTNASFVARYDKDVKTLPAEAKPSGEWKARRLAIYPR